MHQATQQLTQQLTHQIQKIFKTNSTCFLFCCTRTGGIKKDDENSTVYKLKTIPNDYHKIQNALVKDVLRKRKQT